MSRRIDIRNTFALAVALALLVAMLGCSSDSDLTATPDVAVESSVAPPPPGAIKILPGKNDDRQIAMDGGWDYDDDDGDDDDGDDEDNFYSQNFVKIEQTVVEEIDEDGGRISNGIVTLIFPEGALRDEVDISISMDPSGLLIFDCAPHGIQFRAPVKVELNLAGTNYEGKASEVDIMWWDARNQEWVRIHQVGDKGSNTARAVLWHFSKYSGVGG